MTKITVKDTKFIVISVNESDYIYLTDIEKYKSDDPTTVIRNWLCNRNALEQPKQHLSTIFRHTIKVTNILNRINELDIYLPTTKTKSQSIHSELIGFYLYWKFL